MCSIRIEMLDDDTYTIEVTLEKPADDKEMSKPDYYPRHVSKTVTASDADEVKACVDEYLPALKPRREAAEFDEAFSQATGDKNSE